MCTWRPWSVTRFAECGVGGCCCRESTVARKIKTMYAVGFTWFHLLYFFILRLLKFPHTHTHTFRFADSKSAPRVRNTRQVSESRASSRFVCFVALPLCVMHFYDSLIEKHAFLKIDSQDFEHWERH